jgi:hypothetical protein
MFFMEEYTGRREVVHVREAKMEEAMGLKQHSQPDIETNTSRKRMKSWSRGVIPMQKYKRMRRRGDKV